MKTPISTVIGTQTISPGYQFTDGDPLEETARKIAALGCDIIKIHALDDEIADRVLTYGDFKHVLMWYRSGPIFTEAEREIDYRAMYAYTKRLLTTYNGSGISFYLGHWEGDWYYLGGYDIEKKTVDPAITEGMIAWLNNRQRAVEDARRDTPHENVWVWHYAEINRPIDAIDLGYDRMLNRVVPYLHVDYLSYSAYDCMELSPEKVRQVIQTLTETLPPKEGIEGPRIIIGEFGMPQHMCDSDPEKHAKINLGMFAKYLACPVKFILYWQMYCNEKLEDGTPRGFWLVDDHNCETPLYAALKDALAKEKAFITNFIKEHGREPTLEEQKAFLLSLPCFGG